MNVVARKKIIEFVKKHTDSKEALSNWYYDASSSIWETPQDIKDRYRSASFISRNTVIFNIKGNKYRLVTKIAFNTKTVYIKWIGTHAEYNKMNFEEGV